jgi:hypothetical protein
MLTMRPNDRALFTMTELLTHQPFACPRNDGRAAAAETRPAGVWIEVIDGSLARPHQIPQCGFPRKEVDGLLD